MRFLDIICLAVCFLHLVVSLFVNLINGKKIRSICKQCLQPVVSGEEHHCVPLSAEQLELLEAFILSIKS